MSLEHITFERANESTKQKEKEEKILDALAQAKVEEEGVVLKSIEDLSAHQLAGFIEKELQTENGEWLPYSLMKKKPFYAFMVQAALDVVSDKMMIDSDKDGTKDTELVVNIKGKEKTFDDHLGEMGGIDDNYGSGTRLLVGKFQDIMGIHKDGSAGPQTMAHLVALLKNEKLENIAVQGFDNKKTYTYSAIGKIDNFLVSAPPIKTEVVGDKEYEIIGDKKLEIKKQDKKPIAFWKEDYIICVGNDRYYGDGKCIINGKEQNRESENWSIEAPLVKNFIESYKNRFDLTHFDRQTEADLGVLLSDGDKTDTLKSLLDLDDIFWNTMRLGSHEVSLFVKAIEKGHIDDGSIVGLGNSAVFHANNELTEDEENDFVGLSVVNGNKTLKRFGNIEGRKVFEVDGTHTVDDYRFDSVETFFLRLKNGRKIEKLSPIENDLMKHYKNRFDTKDIAGLSANVRILEGSVDKKKSFVSMLNLDDHFWGDYALTTDDVTLLINAMRDDVIDYKTGSDSVFHEYNENERNDYVSLNDKKEPIMKDDQGSTRVFEVDGTSDPRYGVDDYRFDSVEAFLQWIRSRNQ